jgi:hypothetical protein
MADETVSLESRFEVWGIKQPPDKNRCHSTALSDSRDIKVPWKVTMSGGGTEAASADAGSFVWELKKSPSGVCFTDEGIVDGKANSHGIHAYDPEKKCWLMISYGQPQLATDPLFAMTWIPLDITKSTHVTEGTTFVAEGKCVMRDGTVIKTRRRWLFSKVQKDLLEVRFTEGIDNGAPLPDGIGVFERIAK